jgi:hypothetical protein
VRSLVRPLARYRHIMSFHRPFWPTKARCWPLFPLTMLAAVGAMWIAYRSDTQQNSITMGLDKSASNQKRAKYFVVGREHEKY